LRLPRWAELIPPYVIGSIAKEEKLLQQKTQEARTHRTKVPYPAQG